MVEKRSNPSALAATVAHIQRSTRLSSLEVLALLGDQLGRLAQRSTDDTHELARIAAARSEVSAAIDEELLRGIGGR